jgi:mono/diheme cytochrome c family protein
MRIFATIVVTLIVLVAIGAWYVWSGVYNIAASAPHTPAVEWLLSTLESRSVEAHSDGIAAPSLTEPTRIQAGAQVYDSMCRMCHGAPGHDPSEIGQGLNPQPPKLWTDEVQRASDAELYWIVKHGLKMTGMPAFGLTHEDAKLWSVVAFVRQLPELQPEAYNAVVQATEVEQEKGSGEGGEQQH